MRTFRESLKEGERTMLKRFSLALVLLAALAVVPAVVPAVRADGGVEVPPAPTATQSATVSIVGVVLSVITTVIR
jgi:hypothetical protein